MSASRDTEAYRALLEDVLPERLDEGWFSIGGKRNPHNEKLEELAQRRERRDALLEFSNQPMGMTPTAPQKNAVQEMVKQLPIKPMARDLGYVAGKYLGDVIEMAGLRPSDYIYLQNLSEAFLGRFLQEIQNNKEVKEVFAKYFLEQLSLRG